MAATVVVTIWPADHAACVFSADLRGYSLMIDGIHTYYAGATPVLVHNSCENSQPITMDEAVEQATQHVGGEGRVVVSGSGGFQFISESVDANGDTVPRIARFDINRASAHVQ